MPRMDHEFLYDLVYYPFPRNLPFTCFIDNLKQIPLFANFSALVSTVLTLFNQNSNQTYIMGKKMYAREIILKNAYNKSLIWQKTLKITI